MPQEINTALRHKDNVWVRVVIQVANGDEPVGHARVAPVEAAIRVVRGVPSHHFGPASAVEIGQRRQRPGLARPLTIGATPADGAVGVEDRAADHSAPGMTGASAVLRPAGCTASRGAGGHPVARGETGIPWASALAGWHLGSTGGTDAVSGKGRVNSYYSLLTGVSGWFTAGLDVPELREAKTMLKALQWPFHSRCQSSMSHSPSGVRTSTKISFCSSSCPSMRAWVMTCAVAPVSVISR
jgi:hypothetical protein